MTTQPRSFDEISASIGGFRQYMKSSQKQLDTMTSVLGDVVEAQRVTCTRLDTQQAVIKEVTVSLEHLQQSIDTLLEERSGRRRQWRNRAIGASAGAAFMAFTAAIYYNDAALLRIIYTHTVGLLL